MNIVSKDHLVSLETDVGVVNKLVIENKVYYRDFIHNLYCQVQGGAGDLLVFDGLKEIDFSKNINVIFQPTYMEINNRKYKNKITDRLLGATYSAAEENRLEHLLLDLHRVASLFISKSDFRLSYNDQLSVRDIISLFNFQSDCMSGAFLENLVEYIMSIRSLEGIEHFILLNMEDYLTDSEMVQFYENMLCEHISIIDIEARFNHKLQYEHVTIVDKDLCLIEY